MLSESFGPWVGKAENNNISGPRYLHKLAEITNNKKITIAGFELTTLSCRYCRQSFSIVLKQIHNVQSLCGATGQRVRLLTERFLVQVQVVARSFGFFYTFPKLPKLHKLTTAVTSWQQSYNCSNLCTLQLTNRLRCNDLKKNSDWFKLQQPDLTNRNVETMPRILLSFPGSG